MTEAGGGAAGAKQWDPRREWPPHPRRLVAALGVVFDAMIVAHLARVNRQQLLVESFTGRAVIPGRVQGELSGLAYGIAGIGPLLVPTCFATVERMNREQAQRAVDRQRSWHGKAVIEADPTKDRGEAEALELCWRREERCLVSQDANAMLGARNQGTPVFAIPDVLLDFAAQRRLRAENAWQIYLEIVGDEPWNEAWFWRVIDETDRERSRQKFMAHAANFGAVL